MNVHQPYSPTQHSRDERQAAVCPLINGILASWSLCDPNDALFNTFGITRITNALINTTCCPRVFSIKHSSLAYPLAFVICEYVCIYTYVYYMGLSGQHIYIIYCILCTVYKAMKTIHATEIVYACCKNDRLKSMLPFPTTMTKRSSL